MLSLLYKAMRMSLLNNSACRFYCNNHLVPLIAWYVGDVELCCSSVMWCVCVQMRCEVSELVALPLGLHRRARLVCIACMHVCARVACVSLNSITEHNTKA